MIKDTVIKINTLEKNDFERLLKIIEEFSIVTSIRTSNDTKLDREMAVIYIDINPKSMFKAYKDFKDKVDEQLEQYYLYQNKNVELYAKKLRSHFLSSIARSSGPRKPYTLFDLDTQDDDKFQLLIDYIKDLNLIHVVKWISKTRNGYHFIIKAD